MDQRLFKPASDAEVDNRPRDVDIFQMVLYELSHHCETLNYEISHTQHDAFPWVRIQLRVRWDNLTTVSNLILKLRDASSNLDLELRMYP